MDQPIRRAIAEKKLIECRYSNQTRICEPHIYGRFDGEDQLLTYQVGGESRSGNLPEWRRFKLSRVSEFRVLEQTFGGSRDNVFGSDSSWDITYAIVDYV